MAQTQSADVDQISSLDNLEEKALTSAMTVLPEAEGLWTVVSANEYTVGRVNDEFHCDCKGHHYHGRCYHVLRVKYELGVKDVPPLVRPDAIDDMFREFVEPEK